MKKLLGAAAIFLGCFAAAYLHLAAKAQRQKRLQALGRSLLVMRRELSERRRGLGECFDRLSRESTDKAVAAFYAELSARMAELGEREFSAIWSETAEIFSVNPGEAALRLLIPLGDCLGGSELERQCRELEEAARSLEREEDEARKKLPDERKLSFALSLSAGAFLVILLV